MKDLIKSTPANSIEIGILESIDREKRTHVDATIEGTPAGFRLLAAILQEMADFVDSNSNDSPGWALSLSPEDIAALTTRNVRNVGLNCVHDKQ